MLYSDCRQFKKKTQHYIEADTPQKSMIIQLNSTNTKITTKKKKKTSLHFSNANNYYQVSNVILTSWSIKYLVTSDYSFSLQEIEQFYNHFM